MIIPLGISVKGDLKLVFPDHRHFISSHIENFSKALGDKSILPVFLKPLWIAKGTYKMIPFLNKNFL